MPQAVAAMSNDKISEPPLPQEVVVLVDVHLKIWTMYINWATWFFGANVLSAGWMINSTVVHIRFAKGLIFVFALTLLAAIAANAILYVYVRDIRQRAGVLLGDAPTSQKTIDGIFAPRFANYVCGAFTALYFAMLAMWAFQYANL
jgi:hypothetical protein